MKKLTKRQRQNIVRSPKPFGLPQDEQEESLFDGWLILDEEDYKEWGKDKEGDRITRIETKHTPDDEYGLGI